MRPFTRGSRREPKAGLSLPEGDPDMPEKGLKALREPVYRLIDPVVRGLIRLKVHPNAVSTVGFVTTLAAGLLYHQDHVRTAGLLVLLGGSSTSSMAGWLAKAASNPSSGPFTTRPWTD